MRRSVARSCGGLLGAAVALVVAATGGMGVADAAPLAPAASLGDPTVRILAPEQLDNGRVRECARVRWHAVPRAEAGGAAAAHRAVVRHHVLARSDSNGRPQTVERVRRAHALTPRGATRRYCVTHDRATSRGLARTRLRSGQMQAAAASQLVISWEARQTVDSRGDGTHDALGLTQAASNPSALGAVPCDMGGMDTLTALTTCRNWTVFPSPAGDDNAPVATLQAQLQQLYDAGFRGLSTYTVNGNMKNVPAIAKKIGFQKVLAGLWDPPNEIDTLPSIGGSIDGVVVGNEGLFRGDYSLADLQGWIGQVRAKFSDRPPNLLPITTSDVWYLYLPSQPTGPGLMALGDFRYPNLHAFWDNNPASNGLFSANPNLGAEFVRQQVASNFTGGPAGRVAVLHESWWPSQLSAASGCMLQPNDVPAPVPPPTGPQWKSYAGRPYTEAAQRQYFSELLGKRNVKFIWGEPFDIAGKRECKSPPPAGYGGDAGPHWGLWDETGAPKAVASVIDYGHYP